MTAETTISSKQTLTLLHRAYNAFCAATPRIRPWFVYGIPKSGKVVALMLGASAPGEVEVVDAPIPRRTLVVDDVYDSGRTAKPYLEADYPVAVLLARPAPGEVPNLFAGGALPESYAVMPWEGEDAIGPEDAVRRLLQFLGRDPDDPAVKETPRRVLSLYAELRDAQRAVVNGTTFATEGDDLVVVRDIPFHSLCEHHILPYSGVAHVGYIPDGRVLGLSKFARVVAQQAAGATIQEGVTHAIATAISHMSASPNVAVVTEASHSCMTLRGAKAFGSSTSASAMLGLFRTDSALRAEFLTLVRGLR